MRLNQYRLRTRIFFGFGLLIALLLGTAAFGDYGLSVVGLELRRMETTTGNLRRVEEVAFRLEQIRRGLTRYRIDADQASLTEVTEANARAALLLQEAARFSLSDQRTQMYNSVAETLRVTAANSDRFATMMAAGLAGRTKMIETGAALDAAAKRLADSLVADGASDGLGAALNALGAARSAENAGWQTIATRDPDSVAGARKQAADAINALTVLEKDAPAPRKPAIQAVHAALDLHTATFNATAKALIEGDSIYTGQIRLAIRDMQAVAARALEGLSAGFDTASKDADTVASDTLSREIGLSAASALIGGILAFVIARSIIRPVNSITAAMTKLAAGDTESDVPDRGARTEIGEMAGAVEVFRQQAIDNVALAARAEQERAAKERRQKAMDIYTQDFGSSVSGVMQSFMESAASMRTAASDVNEGARQTRESTSATAEGAMASARDLNSVASAAEEMAVSINEISQQVAHVTTSVQAAVDRAAETDSKVAGLSETADRIGDVVRMITDIAGQTNLLALNATIEAARAGEAGKGFAVVAGEVKALATQTARATEQIGAQIVAIRNATGEAAGAVREVGAAIGKVETVATAIAAAVEQQSAATREITNSVQMVTATTSNAAEAMRGVLSIAERADSNSVSALQAACEVGETAEKLRAELTDFLNALSRGDEAERRLYERIPGGGNRATCRIGGQPAEDLIIVDIGRGGMAVRKDANDDIGTDIEISLPGGGAIRGRIARSGNGVIGIAFRQDAESLVRIDRALQVVGQTAGQAAA
jgi:methyl-accepting chemotaxis protein